MSKRWNDPIYWTRVSIRDGFGVHGIGSLADLCDEMFSLDKISDFSVENNASQYIFMIRSMKKRAKGKEIEFLDLIESTIKQNLRKQIKNCKLGNDRF